MEICLQVLTATVWTSIISMEQDSKKTVDGVVYMKKYFVGLPVVLIWFAMSPICIFCFLLCVNEFLWFGIIAFLSIPLIIGIILIATLCQYVIIDEKGITKYNILGQIVLQFDWNKIKEIRIDTVWIYVSPWLLANEKKYWNASHLIVFIYSEKIMRVLKQYIPENITTNFESKGQR